MSSTLLALTWSGKPPHETHAVLDMRQSRPIRRVDLPVLPTLLRGASLAKGMPYFGGPSHGPSKDLCRDAGDEVGNMSVLRRGGAPAPEK